MPEKPFEIPQELRRLAEENVERARQLFIQFMDGVARVWSASASDVIKPKFNAIRERAAKFAKENADAAFTLAKQVAQARDLRELLDLQTRYVQSQMRWYANQTQEFGKLLVMTAADIKGVQHLLASSDGPRPPNKVEVANEVTNLKLTGFSIEVDIDPVTLLLETDKGPFRLEIPKNQLEKLVYALRFVLYAYEPLQKTRLKKQRAAKPTALVTRPSRPTERKRNRRKKK